MAMTIGIISFEKVLQWKQLQKTLKETKQAEMALRKELCSEILKGQALPARKTICVGEVELKAENGISHVFDEAALNELLPELDSEEKECIKWNPEVRVRQYKKLPKESLLHEVVITKPSSPTLTVVGEEE